MASTDVIGGGNIEPRALEDEMRTAYLDYAMSVIVGRALPDVRDGLMPVHRRVLYSMNEQGLGPTRPYVKSARIVGEVMGKYHPHGDSAIYDTLVRLAQDFSMRHPLVDGQGNFGSVDDDPAAAMRYTEARLTRIAQEMLRDLDMETVDFVPNYDGSTNEPVVLPSRFPNLLVNGSSGIAVGMATNIPPHNLREIAAAVIAYVQDPSISVEGLMAHVKGPDFPTGGIIIGQQGIRDAYETGRGRVRVRGKAHIEELGRGREAIIVTELPFMVKKGGEGGLMTKIGALVEDKKLGGIAKLKDLSSERGGMRLVIECKRDADPRVVLNLLYKHTPMQSTFGVNTVALVDGVPRTLSLREVIHHYVQHQRDVVVRRAKFELNQREARAHVLEGLLVALDNLDAIIALIRASRDRESARGELVSRFDLSVRQASAILDLRLSQLTALEADALRREHAEVIERIGELRTLLGDEQNVLDLITEELRELVGAYGDERRTQLAPSEDEIDIEDLIREQQMVVTITQSGYIKTLPLGTYRQQIRGGIGVNGMDLKEGDFTEHLFVCSTHDYLLFFSNRGKVYRSKVYELPEMGRTARGRALVNVLPLRDGERIQSVLATRDYTEGAYVVFATRRGVVKKTAFGAYDTPIKADGIIAINVREDDELVAVRRTSGDDDILIVSRDGLAVRFNERDARPMGRDTSGVRGMTIEGKDNEVLAMDVARDDQELLVITKGGFGKRTGVDEYRKTIRGAKGVQTIRFSERRGGLAAALVVRPHQELLFISQAGMVQRTNVRGIRETGRAAQGVRVMNIREDDAVSAVALVVESEADAVELEETALATDSPVGLEAGGHLDVPTEHAPEPEAMLDADVARAAEAALDDAGAPDDEDEIDV
ncbi:MAG: DNA gyrase subunit A [Solirubrobacterales bacterium]|nr:DNA gyrase subunit A [Solirubrobacterales bacterium]